MENTIKGYLAHYNGKTLEITKEEANSLYSAKMYAIKELKLSKKQSYLLSINPAY